MAHGHLSDARIQVLAERNCRFKFPLFDFCPLCGVCQPLGGGAIEDHVVGHLRHLALKFLPISEEEELDESNASETGKFSLGLQSRKTISSDGDTHSSIIVSDLDEKLRLRREEEEEEEEYHCEHPPEMRLGISSEESFGTEDNTSGFETFIRDVEMRAGGSGLRSRLLAWLKKDSPPSSASQPKQNPSLLDVERELSDKIYMAEQPRSIGEEMHHIAAALDRDTLRRIEAIAYECQFCDRLFRNESKLERHVLKVHRQWAEASHSLAHEVQVLRDTVTRAKGSAQLTLGTTI
ncbi:hypothetical protein E4U42_003956 [Claviceps africana]|uniref:C2H2-type domain-containing protein n=1 Tax=Claviceps africana TaxID=83212 RepID=A0A8K0J8A7_9HYPO|nr:hypothetical protein E4U42_003956 [Claviceps africana]